MRQVISAITSSVTAMNCTAQIQLTGSANVYAEKNLAHKMQIVVQIFAPMEFVPQLVEYKGVHALLEQALDASVLQDINVKLGGLGDIVIFYKT